MDKGFELNSEIDQIVLIDGRAPDATTVINSRPRSADHSAPRGHASGLGGIFITQAVLQRLRITRDAEPASAAEGLNAIRGVGVCERRGKSGDNQKQQETKGPGVQRAYAQECYSHEALLFPQAKESGENGETDIPAVSSIDHFFPLEAFPASPNRALGFFRRPTPLAFSKLCGKV
jgi:hypothetical protein